MTPRVARLLLPYPPSANEYWRHTAKHGRAITYPSEIGKTYKAVVAELARRQFGSQPFTGPVRLLVDVFRPRRSGDLGNRVKVLEDALNAVAYGDDGQTIRIAFERWECADRPRVQVTVVEDGRDRAMPEPWPVPSDLQRAWDLGLAQIEAAHRKTGNRTKKPAARSGGKHRKATPAAARLARAYIPRETDWKQQEREFKLQRLAEVLRKDPELTDADVAERLGLSQVQVLMYRRKLGLKKGSTT